MKRQFQSAYDKLANDQRYITVDFHLKVITWTVAIFSGISTAYTNGVSHAAKLGLWCAVLLGVGTLFIVEYSLYTLEAGLRSTFKGGTQRALATFGKWTIKATMIANAAYLCCVIADLSIPEALSVWNRWSFAVHFAIGLVLIPLIRDADPVVANRMLQLRAETAQEDQIVSRLASALASPFALFGARLRGHCDGLWLGLRLLFNRAGFSSKSYVTNLNALHRERFGYVEGGNRQNSTVLNLPSQGTIRLAGAQATAPLLAPAGQNQRHNPKVPARVAKTSSVGGVSLPDMPKIHFEPNNKGGIEAWYRPDRTSPRSDRKYLRHFGQKELARLGASFDGGESEIRQTVEEAARQKGIRL